MLKTLLIGFFLVLTLQGAKVTTAPTVTLGEGRLGVVHFPGEFIRKNVSYGSITVNKLVTTLRYEIRLNPNSANELIFVMKDIGQQGELVDSDDFYAVSLDGQFKTRRVTAEEWRAAQALAATRRDDGYASEREITVGENGVTYKGKLYPTAAGVTSSETRSFLSPGAKWLAVYSDTSKLTHHQGIPGFDGGGRTAGRMFIEVYETKSGNKVLAGSAAHVGSAATLFANSVWVGDNYFVIAIDPHGEDTGSVGQNCFLAILPTE